VVLGNDEKEAIYHFEMPVTIFQDLISIDHGRMFIIDSQGYLIADSQYQYPVTNISQEFTEFFPSGTTVFPPTEFDKLLQQTSSKSQGKFVYDDENGDTFHVSFKQLPTFGWIMLYQESEELMMSEFQTELGSIFFNIVIIASLITAGGLMMNIFISEKLARPIINLRNAAKNVEDGIFDTKIKTSRIDEVADLEESFMSMTKSLEKTIELEKELAITQNELKNEKFVSIGILASRLTHDLRNPLTVITAAIELMNKKNPETIKENKRYFDMINDAIARLHHQIDGVLDFVRTQELHLETVSTKKIIDSVLNSVDIPKNVHIEKIVEDVEIKCDPKNIEIVIINLITNAIQAMNETGQITIRLTDQLKQITIEFEDSGSGIPDKNLNKIFEPLFTTKQKGTGLGLSSCKSIIQQHGGTIHVKNNPTTFTIQLPKRIS